MLRIDSVLAAVLAVGHPGLLRAAFNCFCQSYTAAVNCSADRSTFSPPLTTAVNRQLSRHSAGPGHHVGRNSHLESDPAFAGELPAPKRPRCGVARNRPCPAHTIPDRLGARPGHATAHPRLVSGAPSCGEERPVNRPPGRDQGPPDHGGSTLPHRGPQPVPHHHHLLEHGSFGRSGRPSGSTPRCSSSPLSTALNRVPSRPGRGNEKGYASYCTSRVRWRATPGPGSRLESLRPCCLVGGLSGISYRQQCLSL